MRGPMPVDLGRIERISQRTGLCARANRHYRIHDGLRYDGCGAGSGAWSKYKKLVGGGTYQDREQHGSSCAARNSDMTIPSVKAIVEYINDNGTIEGAPGTSR
jgi:hypothetical protein